MSSEVLPLLAFLTQYLGLHHRTLVLLRRGPPPAEPLLPVDRLTRCRKLPLLLTTMQASCVIDASATVRSGDAAAVMRIRLKIG